MLMEIVKEVRSNHISKAHSQRSSLRQRPQKLKLIYYLGRNTNFRRMREEKKTLYFALGKKQLFPDVQKRIYHQRLNVNGAN